MARADSPAGFTDIHRALGAAMRAAARNAWPARPHLGGPLPVLSAAAQLELAFGLAPIARELAASSEHAAFDEAVALARRVGATEELRRSVLDDASKPSRRDGPALRVAKLVVRAASNFRFAPPSARDSVGRNLESIAVAITLALGARGAEAVHAFLMRVDAELVRAELGILLRDRDLAPSRPLLRVLSRPRNPKGTLALALAALDDGSYGLYAKLKARWEWHEGDRSTVFATVPDAYMETVIADLEAA